MEKIYICLYGSAYGLNTGTDETIDKLNTVSDTINEMAKNYKAESNKSTVNSDPKTIFILGLKEKLEDMKDNVLYEDFIDDDSTLSSSMFDILIEKDITKEDIIKLLEARNQYILGFDDFDTNMKIEEDINKIARIANDTYKIGRINSIWNQKLSENKKVISSQLGGVSRAISNVAESIGRTNEGFEDEKQEIRILCKQKGIELADIEIKELKNKKYIVQTYIPVCKDREDCRTYEIENIISKVLNERIVLYKDSCALKADKDICKQTYMSKDKFSLQIAVATGKKDGSIASGDSNLTTRLEDGKYVIAISDGMGSGADAKKSSELAVKMLERLLSTGFDKDTSLELINSSMYINSKEDSYATLDVAILDLFAGNMEFMKNGACPTFIKNKKNVSVVKSFSLPARNTWPSRLSCIW